MIDAVVQATGRIRRVIDPNSGVRISRSLMVSMRKWHQCSNGRMAAELVGI